MKISDDKQYIIHAKNQIMLSISTDCADCEAHREDKTKLTTSAEDVSDESNNDLSQPSEVVAQSSAAQHSKDSCEVNFSFSSKSCKGKLYILARNTGPGRQKQYFLYIINMDGGIQHQVELKSLDNKELKQAKIFCIRNRKVVILDITEDNIDMYIFNYEGKYLKTIDMKQYLTEGFFGKLTIFTISYNGDIVCSEEKSKLTIYNIDEENNIQKTSNTIKLSKEGQYVSTCVPQSVAFNRKFEELIILCYTSIPLSLSRPQYHLLIYTTSGTLKKDIKLRDNGTNNGSYGEAALIYQQNGPVVLLDNHQLLHLK